MAHASKVVVITGASSGIGRATAHEFAREGARLVLASRRGDVLDDVVRECERLGGQAIAVPTDVTVEAQVEALATAARNRYGRLDVWVNNASVAAFGALTELPVATIKRVLDVNVLGYVYGCRAALGVMTEQGAGSIVNVASVIGEVPQALNAPYSMAKAAVRGLGSSLRQELALQGARSISISSVLPPTIDTPFFSHSGNYSGREVRAMPPVYPPEAVAKVIVKASRKRSAEIAVGAAGKTFVREHRRHPEAIEKQMGVQTNAGQFRRGRSAETTDGNLFEPSPSADAAVSGGWGGARRSRSRSLVGLLFVGGALVGVTRFIRTHAAHS
jgi:short-subunit dehydrogenase